MHAHPDRWGRPPAGLLRGALLALALAAGIDAAAAGESSQQSLADFDSLEQLARWSVRPPAHLGRTSAWCSSPPTAAAVTFGRWQRGGQPWPAAILATLPVSDWSTYDRLEMDVYNPQPGRQVLRLNLRDARGGQAQLTVAIPGAAAVAVREPLAQFAPTVDLRHMRELHLYASRPETTFTLYVDDIRLRRDTAAQASELAAAALALADSLAALHGALGEVVPASLAEADERLASVAHRAAALAADLQTDGLLAPLTVRLARWRWPRLQREFLAARAAAPRLAGLQQARLTGNRDFALAVESPARKVFLEAGRLASPLALQAELTAARHEYESFQAIVIPVLGPLRQVTWRLTPPRPDSGAGPELPGSVRLVGYVHTSQPSYPVPHTGWWPDPLLDCVDGVDFVPEDEVLPLWVTVYVPAQASPGLYRGALEVAAAGAATQRLAIEVRVRSFALPRRAPLRTALSLRELSPPLYPAEALNAMRRRYENWLLAEYGLDPGDIYSPSPPPWDEARLRELVALGLDGINLGYVNAPLEPDLDVGAHWDRLAAQMEAMAAYLRIAEAAGARDLCYIYCFDERPRDQLDIVFETAARLRARFPDIEVMTTADDPAFGLGRRHGEAVSIWAVLTPEFDANAAAVAAARQQGRDIWWYVAISPRQPFANLFVEGDAMEARLLLGAMAARYRPGGFLYYALNRWPANDHPIRSGPRTDWNPASYLHNNGDGSLICAGPHGPLATIRLENLRDGREDLAYYQLLRAALAGAGLPATQADVPAALVGDLATFSRDPAVLHAERERVAALLEVLGP